MDYTEFMSDKDYIFSLLPKNWKEKFNEFGLLKFGRKFSGPNKEVDFLQVMLMHLCCGYSFRTTVAQAKAGNIVDICDVTLFNHFKKCKQFFMWCLSELIHDNRMQFHDLFGNDHCWIAVDGTIVKEEGVTGSLYRIHYAINLNDLSVNDIKITQFKEGESLARFNIVKNGVYLGDRAFAKFPGIEHVVEAGGDVLCRCSPSFLKMFTLSGKPLPLMKYLRELRYNDVLDIDVLIGTGDKKIKGRLCAIKRTEEAKKEEVAKTTRSAQLKGRVPGAETLELCGFLLIFTTLPREQYSALTITRIYRLRWQIEIVFKRLKSLLELGQLHKHDPDSIITFLAGKLLVALLIEKMINQAEDFSPL